MRRVIVNEFMSLDGVAQAPAVPTWTRAAGSPTAAGTCSTWTTTSGGAGCLKNCRSGRLPAGTPHLRDLRATAVAALKQGDGGDLHVIGSTELVRTLIELTAQPPAVQDFAEIWTAAEKIVYSKTLQTASSARTRIERDFDPEAVRQLKAEASRDLAIGGPELAAQAIEAGLVDEYQLLLVPVVVGGGKRSLPARRLKLELLDERRFRNGTVYLHYRTRGPS